MKELWKTTSISLQYFKACNLKANLSHCVLNLGGLD